jgi:signal transduction histidine kinase
MMNSLTPIISLSETFSDDETTDCAMMGKAMKTIHRRSKNLVQFVANYQKLTRIPAPVLSVLQIEEIMEDISSLLKAQNIKFQYTIFPNNITLNADKGQMEQVLINLIKNAWEACCHLQTPDVRVDIRTDEYQRILISVSDNGHGILKEVTDKIFIPFFTTKKDGSGIGLSICRQIISAHGGTISVSSEPDKGATFLIRM